jgi:carboxylesterase type B
MHKVEGLRRSRELAKLLGCNDESEEGPLSDATLSCLRKLDSNTITQVQYMPSIAKGTIVNGNFGPIYGDELLPQEPIQALRDGNYKKKAALLFGVTTDEGSLVDPGMSESFDRTKLSTIADYKSAVKTILEDMQVASAVADDIVQFYYSKVADSDLDAAFKAYTDIIGDLSLGCPTLLFAENVLEDNKVFGYHLNYKLEYDALGFCPKHRGVCHGADMPLLFGLAFLTPEKYSENERKETKNMIKIWTDFAKNDAADWPAHYKTHDGTVVPINKEINLSAGNPTKSDFNYLACRVLSEAVYSLNPRLQK